MTSRAATTKHAVDHARIVIDEEGVTEELLAEPLGQDFHRILNIPFSVSSVSYGDIVRATPEERRLRLNEVTHHSGHSTFRLTIEWALIDQFLENYWTQFELMGCTYDGRKGTVYQIAMDVPPEADLSKIETMLEKGRKIGLWQYDRGYCAH